MSDSNSNLPQTQRGRALVTDEESLFDTAKFDQIARVAGVMGKSSLIPNHLRVMRDREDRLVVSDSQVPAYVDVEATTANCFLIVNQARLFGGIDPFALAQLSYFVHGRLGFEGKLIQAVIERRIGALRFDYFGEPGTQAYGVTVTGWIPGADPAREASISGTVEEWQTKKNGNPLQQWQGRAGQTRMLHYRGTREWGRMYAPGLVLGLLDEDDLDAIRENHRAERARPVNGNTIPAAALAQVTRQNPLEDGPEDEVLDVTPQRPAQEAAPVAQEGQGQASAPAAANPAPEPPAAAGGATAPKRAPRGANQKVDRLELAFEQAKTVADVEAVWTRNCQEFFAEMEPTGWDYSAAKDRLNERRATRIAVLENADPKTGEVKPKPATASSPRPANDEVQENLAQALQAFRDAAATVQSFDALDTLVDEMVNPHPFNPDQDREVDAIVERERTRLAAAIRAAESNTVATGQENAEQRFPGDVDEPAGDRDFPGDAAIKALEDPKRLTDEELQETVDGWSTSMRKCKSLEDLERFNVETITPFMQSENGKRLSPDLVEDARTTFENRKRLLAKMPKPGA